MQVWRFAYLAAITGIAMGGCGTAAPTSAPQISGATTSASLAPATSGCPNIGAVSDHGSAAASGNPIVISVGDSYFAPTCLTGVRQGTITVRLTNSGSALHNFSLPDQNIDNDIPPGQSITVTVRMGSAPLSYFCKYHRTSGMVGQFAAASS